MARGINPGINHEAQLTFRMDAATRAAFAAKCDTTGLAESNVARLLVGGWLLGSIDIVAHGTTNAPPTVNRQLALAGVPAPKRARRGKGKRK